MLDLSALKALQEETNIRRVPNVVHCSKAFACTSVIILTSDTNVLLQLVSL